MITITCCNKSCPKGKFDWNVLIDCMPAKLEDQKAVWKKAFCPHCNQLNWIFVKCKRKRRVTRKGKGISNITIKGRSIRHTSTGGRRISGIGIRGIPISNRGIRISNRGRRIGQLRRVPQQSEDHGDQGDQGPHEVPVAMRILKTPRKHRDIPKKYIANGVERGENQNTPMTIKGYENRIRLKHER